nr:MAG TPA: hypothetical protein [Caudoviricetes sp.]
MYDLVVETGWGFLLSPPLGYLLTITGLLLYRINLLLSIN